MQDGWQRTQVGKRNSPLCRCEVWSGVDEAPGGNLLTSAVSQAKRRSPGWGVGEFRVWGGGTWAGSGQKHYIWPPHVCRTKRSCWLTVNWTLGPILRPRLKRRQGRKTRGTHTHAHTHTHTHTPTEPILRLPVSHHITPEPHTQTNTHVRSVKDETHLLIAQKAWLL